MMNQKTPVQGGASEEQIEATAVNLSETAQRIKREWLATHEGSGFEDLYATEFDSMLASASASASADPADEHHDAESQIEHVAAFGFDRLAEACRDPLRWAEHPEHGVTRSWHRTLAAFHLEAVAALGQKFTDRPALENEIARIVDDACDGHIGFEERKPIVEQVLATLPGAVAALYEHHDAEERQAEGEDYQEWLDGERSVSDALHFAANPESEGCRDDGCLHYDHPPEGEDHAATVTEFGPDECRGDGSCPGPVHVHGCFGDDGKCDNPADHATTVTGDDAWVDRPFANEVAAKMGVSVQERQRMHVRKIVSEWGAALYSMEDTVDRLLEALAVGAPAPREPLEVDNVADLIGARLSWASLHWSLNSRDMHEALAKTLVEWSLRRGR